jgi:ubiquinone/menaquinone biosynthesis C-methylase UbiE
MEVREKDFNDIEFAGEYGKKHARLLRNWGKIYAKKLVKRNFVNGKILDAGCGSGEMMVALAPYFPECEITGIDISNPLLEYASRLKTIHHLNGHVQFINGDVKKMAFTDNHFDVVFNVNMVHFIDDPIPMLNEIERVLKPDGYLFIRDLRCSWLKIFEGEIGNSFYIKEARDVLNRSNLRKGIFSKSLLWWNYEAYQSSRYMGRSNKMESEHESKPYNYRSSI